MGSGSVVVEEQERPPAAKKCSGLTESVSNIATLIVLS